MNVLVTGGAGFIGSNLVYELSKKHDVTVLDNFHTGIADNLKDKITVVNDSSRNIGDRFSNADIDIDAIFHLGIPSSSPMYKENPMLVGSAINDAMNVFEFAKKTGAKVVFASSSSLYNGLPTPNKEDMDVMVADYYTEARFGIERVAELYHKLYGISVVGLRFFSVYGPNERAKGIYANIISQFLWEMQDGKIPVIYGDGKQTRDFVFVSDVVRACILAMETDVSGIFNVGTGVSHSFNDVVNLLNNALGTDIKPQYIENPVKNYVAHTLADLTKVKTAIGFRSKYSLEEGISEIV
ncbi:MAG: ADP-L-glycero-D-manno-heptose-6-epimerase [Candidatus Argoarchaeum ethanivorans]|uniref:ADP-L-glycero-D-manno-heptose-6-epimerase n=1 Tax=Candidatus Argoarchaeum ethanivorans TaxID=2608793 RepID=A0A811TE73_9EURY|nr:MAG: ADP-L-glycero-D-manno-heptose-6-epimerase [Candidatus Argoarchaeum ethanivorans]